MHAVWATVWDIHQSDRKIRSLKGGACDSILDSLSDRPRNCVWSPDGTWIAAGAPMGGKVHIWETTTFQLLHTWEGSELLAFSADGCWVVTATPGPQTSSKPDPTRPTTAWVWAAQSGKLHRSLQGHTDGVCAAAFNSGSTRIVTGSLDSTIRIWDAQTGEQLLVLEETQERSCIGLEWIDFVAFSGDGRMVLSHSSKTWDGSDTVRVWDASNGTLLKSLSQTHLAGQSIVHSTCFSPCGSYLASLSDDKGVLLWRTSDWSCIAEVSARGEVVTRVAISPDGRVLCYGTRAGTVFFRRMRDLTSATQD